MAKGVSDSQFYMWRTLFAIVHVDNVVATQEVRFMAEAFEDIPFSEEQRAILNDDIKNPQNIEEMFKGITNVHDQATFFKYARELVHIDGDYGAQEQEIMARLQKLHIQGANLDDLVGNVTLELEEEDRLNIMPSMKKRSLGEVLSLLAEFFVKNKTY